MTLTETWGSIVTDLMREQGVTQRRLAEVAGINRSTLRKLCVGYENITIGDLTKVLSVLGYDFDVFNVSEPSVLLKKAKLEAPREAAKASETAATHQKRLVPYYNGGPIYAA